MARFRVSLFDLDGTLIDTEPQYEVFWNRVVEDKNITYPDFYHSIRGRTLQAVFKDYGFSEAMQHEITDRMNAFEAQMDFPFFPGALEFVQDIRQHGVKCAVVTSSNQAKLSSVRHKIKGFDDLFDSVLTAEDFTASKPAPDCYLLGARVFDAKIEDCVVFEDAVNGLQAGMASGAYTIGFATGFPRNIIAPLCHHVEDDFRELSYNRICELLNSRVG